MDADTQAFLELAETEIGPWTAARAAARELDPPAAALPGVVDNVDLLKRQAALFLAALEGRADAPLEGFAP